MRFTWSRKPSVVAAAGTLLIVLASAATVHVNYHNRWTGLFCIGDRVPLPPLLANSYVFPNSYGFDGQFYRDIAHDPFNQRGFGQYIDDPRLRYERILVPVMANLLALGRESWIDGIYIGLEWFSASLGVYWVGRFAQSTGRSAWWGIVYLALPCTLIALDRMLSDLPFTTLCVGFFYFAYRKQWWGMFLSAMLACLAREMGVLLVGSYIAYLLWHRHFRSAIIFAGALIPFAGWWLLESRLTLGKHLPYACCSYPGSAIVDALCTRFPSALLPAIVRGTDILSLLSFVVCAILYWSVARGRASAGTSPAMWVGAGFVLLGVLTSCTPNSFNHVYDYGRQYSPLLVVLLFAAIEERRVMLLVPIAFMTLRVGVQVFPQVAAILRRI